MHPTESFLSLVWPSEGNKCIVTIKDRIVKHYWYDNITEAATACLQHTKITDVYYGLAGFTGRERKADQAVSYRAIWLDVDCGLGKAYVSKSTAGAALESFLVTTGLPVPLIVSSGNGLHIYWIFDEDVAYEEWYRLAQALKLLCNTRGLHADAKCTADAARILRPINTLNYKCTPPRLVKVLNRSSITASLEHVRATLLDHGVTHQFFDWETTPSHTQSPITNPFASFELPTTVAEGGRNDTLFKLGSSLRAKGYSNDDIRRELHRVNQTHCHPPLNTAEVDIIAASCSKYIQGLTEVKKVNGILTFRNQRLRVNGNGLEVSMPNGKGADTQWEWIPLADHGIRPLMEVRLPNAAGMLSHYVWMETYNDQDRPEKSFLVHSTGITNSATFATECADNGYSFNSEKSPAAYRAFHHIMREWVRKLQHSQGQAITFKSFGWVGPDKAPKDSFLLGNVIYRKDGPHAAPPVPTLFSYQEDMVQKGTLAAWTAAIDNYNLPGMEAYMFASWTAWAAPLMIFTTSQNIVFHLTGHTGVGKSSLQRSIVSTYGDFNSKQMVDANNSTFNSVGGVMGILSALPFCKEEVTELNPDELASWALSMTQGREKGRMNQQLGVQVPRVWNTIAITSANTSLREVIRNQRLDNAASLARVWEQDMSLPLDQMLAIRLFSPLRKNFGHAGPIYVEHLVQNYDDIKQQVIDTEEALFVKLKGRGEERFNIGLLAATFVGASIAINLGLIHHDFQRGRNYAIQQYHRIHHATKSAVQTEDQILSRFLQDALPNMLVVEFDFPGSATTLFDSDNNIIKDVPIGLPILARFAKKEARLYVAMHTLRKWYAEHRLNLDNDLAKLKAAGIFLGSDKKMTLTKGTKRQDRLQVRCYWFDLSRATELVEAVGV